MDKRTRRDDAARYDNHTATDGSPRDERGNLDDSVSRRDKAIGVNQLTHRELAERWPIG